MGLEFVLRTCETRQPHHIPPFGLGVITVSIVFTVVDGQLDVSRLCGSATKVFVKSAS